MAPQILGQADEETDWLAADHLEEKRPASASVGLGGAFAKLIVLTAVVDAVAPLLQEHASKTPGFEGSSMVLGETLSYFVGGLVLSVLADGFSGFQRCLRPARYFAFLPASLAFSMSNFMTYIAVKGLGASQFYLLSQLRVALLAVFLRFWTGTRQSTLAWLALAQLAAGMVVLVWYKASSASSDCGVVGLTESALVTDNITSVAAVSLHGAGPGRLSKEMAARLSMALAERMAFFWGFLALIGVVLSSAFGIIYLEWQLKLHSQDPLYVQLHHLNFFGAAVSLLVHLSHRISLDGTLHSAQQAAALSTVVANGTYLNSTLAAMGEQTIEAAVSQSATEAPGISAFERLILLSCIVARGALSSSVLKRLDAIAKGLIDVTAIVICTGLQILLDTTKADGTILGIQGLMLMAILNYTVARKHNPRPTTPGLPPCGASAVQHINNVFLKVLAPAWRTYHALAELVLGDCSVYTAPAKRAAVVPV